MTTVEKSIIVNVPVRNAYDQWTRFEEFPCFMEGIKEVKHLSEMRLHWKAEIAGHEKEWESEIIERTPDERIVWTGPRGSLYGGVVAFQSISDSRTKILLQRWGMPQKIRSSMSGDGADTVASQLEGDLKRFKEFIETRAHGQTENPVERPNGQIPSSPHRKGME